MSAQTHSKLDTPTVAMIRNDKRRVSGALWAICDTGLLVKGVVEGIASPYASGNYTAAIGSGLSTMGSVAALVVGERADEFTIPAWITAGICWTMGGIQNHEYGIAFLGAMCVVGQISVNRETISNFLAHDRPTQRMIEIVKKIPELKLLTKNIKSPGNRLLNWYAKKALPWGEKALHIGCWGLLAETLRIGINSIAPNLSIPPAVDHVMTKSGLLHGVQLPTATGNLLDGVLAAGVFGLAILGNCVAGMEPVSETNKPLVYKRPRAPGLRILSMN